MNGPGNLRNRTNVQVPPDLNENTYNDIATPNVFNISIARLQATAPLNITSFLGAVPNQLLRLIVEGPEAITLINASGGIGQIRTVSGSNVTLSTGRTYTFSYDSVNEWWSEETVNSSASTVGTLSPGSYLSGGAFNGSSNVTWNVLGTTTNTPDRLVARDSSGDINVGVANATSVNVSNDLTVTDESFLRGLITAYPLSTTNPRTNWPAPLGTTRFLLSAASGDALGFIRGDNGDTSGATIILARTGNVDPGVLALVAQFDTLGNIQFRGAVSASTMGVGAQIGATVEGVPSGSALPTALHFSTTGSSLSSTRRWTINESGMLHPSTSPASDNIYDIGLTGTRVRTGYFGTSVIVGSSTINSTSATFGGSVTVTTDLTVNGNTVIGNASGDTLTIAPSAVTWSNNPTHSGNHTFSGNVVINGNTTIGNATSDTLSITARLATGFDPSADNVRQLGTALLRFANIFSATFTGALVGNASTATTLATARDFSATGDATASAVSFNGSANVVLALTLATVNANIGTFNNVTVNAKGLVTSASNVAYLTANQTITLSGDATGSGTIAITVTIANDAVTYAKMQNVSAASRLLGRGSLGGAGDVEEITLGSGLTMTGTVLSATGGTGDVVGPASAVDNNLAAFDLTTGKIIKDSLIPTANVIVSTGSYSNPAWLTGIAWSKISATPTTIAGYGITDFNSLGDARWVSLTGSYADPVWITSLAYAKITGAPSLTGYVVGPASATDNAIVRYDLTTGKLVQNSSITISDNSELALTLPAVASITGITLNIAAATSQTGIRIIQGAGSSPKALRIDDSTGTNYTEIYHQGTTFIFDATRSNYGPTNFLFTSSIQLNSSEVPLDGTEPVSYTLNNQTSAGAGWTVGAAVTAIRFQSTGGLFSGGTHAIIEERVQNATNTAAHSLAFRIRFNGTAGDSALLTAFEMFPDTVDFYTQIRISPSISSQASFTIFPGVAPSSPVNGDLWTETSAAFWRLNSVTYDILRTPVRKNSGVDVGTRRRLNFIEGANVTLTVADDAANDEVDITVASAGGAFNTAYAAGSFTVATGNFAIQIKSLILTTTQRVTLAGTSRLRVSN